MVIFIKKIFIFLAPLGLIFIFPALVLCLGREYYSVEDVVKTQLTDPSALYGLAFNDMDDSSYKKSILAHLNPEIVVLGKSRGMQFRKEFFAEPEKFVNAADHNSNLEQLDMFVNNLPSDTKIKFIILNLEQDWFGASSTEKYNEGEYKKNIFEMFRDDWRQVYFDYFSGKFSFLELLKQFRETGSVGLNALINKNGYSLDGGYHYGKEAQDPNHKENIALQIDKMWQSMKKQRGYFSFGEKISEKSISLTRDILDFCKKRGIYVAGILPAYPNLYYRELMNKDDSYKKMAIDLPNKLSGLFSEYGFVFYDFSDIRIIGASDSEFYDSIHATNKIALREVIYITERNKFLRKYFDLNGLKKVLLRNAGRDFLDI